MMSMNSPLPIIFFLITCISFNSLPSSASELSYKDHCASIVPESTPTDLGDDAFPLGWYQTGYYTGGKRVLGVDSSRHKNSFDLKTRNIRATDVSGLFKIEASLSFRTSNPYYYGENFSYGGWSQYGPQHHRRRFTTVRLDGFWSESSGKLCMVGTGKAYSKQGNLLDLDAVFKLNNVANSSNITSLISGSLESLSSENHENYFEPISVLMLPRLNYKYTLDSVKAAEFSSGSDAGQSLSTNSLSFCSRWTLGTLQLEYSSDCNSAKNCTPFSGITGYLPSYMYFNQIDCSAGKRRLRVLLRFSNNSYDSFYQPLNPNNMLVGEGWWDEKKNQLRVVACHFMGMTESLANAHVGDCSVRLSLRAPAIWSINDATGIVGQIWSNKTANDLGYFNKITFRNKEDQGGYTLGFPGLKYEYSQQERVRRLCPIQTDVKKQVKWYPNADSYNMRFDMSVRTSNKRIAWGNSDPLFVEDQFYSLDVNAVSESDSDSSSSISVPSVNASSRGLFNISYKISFSLMYDLTSVGENSLFNMSSYPTERVKIIAEGIYDAHTGSLCMVGCRKCRANNGGKMIHSKDCQILVKFQFPPLDSKRRGYIEGSIESTRTKSDPLYFKRLDLLSAATYIEEASRTIWRMDIEIIMVLICTTLQCVFVGFQLHHMKRHPKVLPNISIVMLAILTLGHIIPLVLNFGVLFSRNPDNYDAEPKNDGWPETNQITVRFITIIALMLQVRVLQQTWSARKGDESVKGLWIAEGKAVYVTLALYAAGLFLVVLLAKWHWAIGIDEVLLSSSGSWYWVVLDGLVLDGFLLPQIMLNLFSNSRENALSTSFYLGTTFFSNLLPHAYDLYRTHNYVRQDNGSYFYADPSADIYATAWDIVIPLGGLLFAAIIYLQQRFGGRCILPRRFKGSEGYEKVPVVTEEEAEGEKPKV